MNNKLFKIPWPFVALIGAHIIWGVNTVVAKITLQEIPVMSLSFLRFFLACILLLPFLIQFHPKKPLFSIKLKLEDLPKLLLASFLMITTTLALGYEGLKLTSALHASILGLIVPIVSLLAAWIFLREHIYWVNLLGIGFGIIGAIVILGFPLLFFGSSQAGNLTGDILIILSGTTFVAGTIIAKDVLHKYSALTVTTIAFLVGMVSFFLPAVAEYIQNPTWVKQVTILGVFGVLFIAILSSICAFFLLDWGLKKVDIVKAHLFQYIEPAVTATIAVPLLGERISFSFIIGTVLIVLGVYWGTLGKPHHHHLRHRHQRS